MPGFPDDLNEHEETLIDAVSRGKPWRGADDLPTPEQLADEDFVATMPKIRAAVIRALCLGARKDGAAIDPYGVRIIGARITGTLDLSFATVSVQLWLIHCHIAERPNFVQLQLPRLALSGSHMLAGLYADGVKIDGDLFCDYGFSSKGEVRLLGAVIGGDAEFRGAQLINAGEKALSADRIKIDGGLFCSDGFRTEGEVRLPGTEVRSNAEFCGAQLINPGKNALNADRIKIGGGLFCNDGFRVEGEVRLPSALIGSDATFIGAQLNNPGQYALNADSIKITGSLFCSQGFRAEGEVRLLSAEIGGDATFIGAQLINPGKSAFSTDGIKIDGNLFCQNGFRAEGAVRLLGAVIGGNAVFDGAQLINPGRTAIAADGLKIVGGLLYREGFSIDGLASFTTGRIEKWFEWSPEVWDGELDLSHTRAGQWRDDWTRYGWAGKGTPSIDLKTFHYDALATDNDDGNDPGSRIAWIRRSLGDDFAPGPYETLAKALRTGGDDIGANQVGYAKAVHRAEHRRGQLKTQSNPLARWIWIVTDRLFGATVGYGYKPWKGLVWLAGFLAFGSLFFMANEPLPPNGAGYGIIKPSEPVIFGAALERYQYPDGSGPPAPLARDATPSSHRIGYALPPEYTPFSPFWYSLDTLIPLVDLGQEGAWSPSPIDARFWKDPGGWIVLIYLYIHILAGWVLSTLTVVALTGVIKKD